MTDDQQEASRRYARALAHYLSGGGVLQPVASGVSLIPGEQCFGIAHGELLDWAGPPPDAGGWTAVDAGRLHVTSVRVLFDGSTGRRDVPLSAIRSATSDGARLQLDTTGHGRIGFALPYPDYWHVLLTRLTTGAILEPPAER